MNARAGYPRASLRITVFLIPQCKLVLVAILPPIVSYLLKLGRMSIKLDSTRTESFQQPGQHLTLLANRLSQMFDLL